MSRTYKRRRVERPYWARENTGMECDVCGLCVEGDEWPADLYEEYVTKCEFEHSVNGPGDTVDGRRLSIDVCPDCFEKKLVPALEALGAKVKWIGMD